MRGEFSVIQYFLDDTYEKVREFVDAGEAVAAAMHYTSCIAARLGFTRRVIITDGDDNCAFEWKYGEGITFGDKPPAQEQP